MLLIIDNFDSFTYNLVQCFGELGVEQKVYRSDEITTEEAAALNPDRILISPGPKTPDFAGVSLKIIEAFCHKTPILGVCLGHQCIGQCFGSRIVKATNLMHGKTSMIHHRGDQIFEGLDSPFPAARYHSLVIDPDSVPDSLQVIADTSEGEIMAIKHLEFPVWGVQFHPESLATNQGILILQNFLNQTS
ncbi:MAG: Aminodeoxychorismate/anthranilate synthase component 2 [Candidatus Moanabacter tarae]|mgnify:CR=1 FL=1|uniref:Aminodeoxychorismate/anthranilate synthase component 2 n=1 Tax=Candidatus Moanibacter tarae TaxID=2200854 RepID=A0A2Z4AEH6_9BACT|nr:MAG: Aminodeoxychorismate/anthranilate synthase component 2 [Candidatus Moanabacter tarae]|tara:strand:- start:211 stop:780 length:570 start_codon:yes stop_codon:yes gene_type:complete